MPILLGLVIVMLFVFLALLWNYRRLQAGLKAYRLILDRFGEKEIEAELSEILAQSKTLAERVTAKEKHGQRQDELLQQHDDHLRRVVQQVGLIRYNAFPDVAGDQSYSLALLDMQGDGIVLTTLHGRAEARTYCKQIQRGASSYPLLPEEQQAVYQALQGRGGEKAQREAQAENEERRAYLLGRREEMANYQAQHPSEPRRRPEAASADPEASRHFVSGVKVVSPQEQRGEAAEPSIESETEPEAPQGQTLHTEVTGPLADYIAAAFGDADIEGASALPAEANEERAGDYANISSRSGEGVRVLSERPVPARPRLADRSAQEFAEDAPPPPPDWSESVQDGSAVKKVRPFGGGASASVFASSTGRNMPKGAIAEIPADSDSILEDESEGSSPFQQEADKAREELSADPPDDSDSGRRR